MVVTISKTNIKYDILSHYATLTFRNKILKKEISIKLPGAGLDQQQQQRRLNIPHLQVSQVEYPQAMSYKSNTS